MEFTADRLANLSPSLTLQITNRAKALKSAGEEIYGLAGGEPDVDTPDFIKQAAIAALNDGQTKYTPSAGIPALREAIAAKLKKANKISVDATQVVVCCGAKHACYNALLATLNEGDEVIIPAPYWVSYPEMVKLCGATPVIVETTAASGWKMTAEQFEDAMTPRTKMVIINSPSNPTGAVYTADELAAIGEIAAAEDILILSDEIYENLIYDEASHVSIASLSQELADLTITVNGFSKSWSMTGWRIGYVAAPPAIAKAINLLQDHTTSNATTFAQYGALAALQQPDSFVEDLREEYDVRRNYVLSRLQKIKNIKVVEPKGAFYFFVDMSRIGMSSTDICNKLLERYKIAVIPGIAFGSDKGLRISYCTTLDVLKAGLDRFEEFCNSH